jgi:hypothetical protein
MMNTTAKFPESSHPVQLTHFVSFAAFFAQPSDEKFVKHL